MLRTLITGATGFIGRHLLPHFKHPVILSRHGSKDRGVLSSYDVTAYDWAPDAGPPPLQAFDGIEVVIHLAGEPIASGRWTKRRKQRIHDSRVTGTRHLVKAISSLTHRPRVLISVSAIGYYGSRGDEVLSELSAPGRDFLAQLCVAWEAAALAATQFGIRVVLPRLGVVIGPGGGALAQMVKPFRWGVGGRLGPGSQWMSWIHLADLIQLILFVIQHETITGAINAVAPHSVTNAQFTQTLSKTLGRPAWLPVPAPVLQIALGQFADVLLASQHVIPEVASRAGFTFKYPELPAALRHAVSS